MYYSRLATVGTIAHKLVHEIGNRTASIADLLESVKPSLALFPDTRVTKKWERANRAVLTLDRLTVTFLPLASRSFQRRRQTLILEDRMQECLELNEAAIRNRHVQCRVPPTQTPVRADPGEIDTVLLNLVTNSLYWLGEVPKEKRLLEFELESIFGGKRIQIWVHDSGPGIDPDDLEDVFRPGVTRKPDGIGMGLTVASELVAIYGGVMKALLPPTRLGGASFAFDLPATKPIREDTC